jgi:hypothetical protein
MEEHITTGGCGSNLFLVAKIAFYEVHLGGAGKVLLRPLRKVVEADDLIAFCNEAATQM